MAGYHIREIPRGKFGEISKIVEETKELEDAAFQGVKVMVGCELADLYGAVREYAKSVGFTMRDLEKMADVTAIAFADGTRSERK